MSQEFLDATREQLEAHGRRVGACRDAVERAGVQATGARRRLAEREAALEAAQKAVKAADGTVAEGTRRLEEADRDVRRLQAASGAQHWAGLGLGGWWARMLPPSHCRGCLRKYRNHPPIPPPAEDSLAKFGGPGVPELAAAVAAAVAAGRFRHPPLLLGAQLSLADDRWATAVEAALGRLLDTWVVDNHADQRLLQVRALPEIDGFDAFHSIAHSVS